MNNDFLKKILAEKGGRIELVVLTDDDGEDSFYYTLMKEGDYQSFMEKANKGQEINIHDYGTVLFHGYGDTPPEEIEKLIKEAVEANS